MIESDTPETDGAQFGMGRVSLFFARRLERERNEARAQRDDLLEALKAITPPKALGIDWWCPECKEVMSGKNVTNAERCESCGTYIGDCQPSGEWHKKALAAIAKATGGEG